MYYEGDISQIQQETSFSLFYKTLNVRLVIDPGRCSFTCRFGTRQHGVLGHFNLSSYFVNQWSEYFTREIPKEVESPKRIGRRCPQLSSKRSFLLDLPKSSAITLDLF